MSERDGAPIALTAAEMTDPVALLDRVGTDSPVHKVLLPDGMPGWLVTGYKEARRALSDPRLGRSDEHAGPDLKKYLALYNDEFFRHSMVFNDRPRHTRMKQLVSQAFTPRYLENLRPKVQRITDGLIDGIVAAGETEVIESLAVPLPNSVICDWFGVPMNDREEFRYYCGVVTGLAVSTDENELGAAGKYFDRYLGELIANRRVDGDGDDMISAILHGQEDNATLSDIELRANIFLMLTGSVETAVNMIAGGLLALIRNPEQTARLRADPSLVPQAVEEMLRIDPPVATVAYHFAKDSVAIGDVVVEPGEHVVISMPAANHDAREFPEPGRFDIDRQKPHLSFSHGIHFCLGAPLARLEGEVFFTTLLDRLQDIELAVPESSLEWKPSYYVHRLMALPIRYTASTARG
ncbi:cytochrome P450 [Streptomyces sp. NBC_00249]|uniref:cytochrome P450 family protein n=1 Tax=Streptomyces sp. NBC_00249 TaxID=2975690 RepID=UPI00225770FB|nr:cytochrome P450 [Streptomyces sp. NBC_00249]MCX5199510.1 cytochrome P450 [Streptomyces sp. NBC_00249]